MKDRVGRQQSLALKVLFVICVIGIVAFSELFFFSALIEFSLQSLYAYDVMGNEFP